MSNYGNPPSDPHDQDQGGYGQNPYGQQPGYGGGPSGPSGPAGAMPHTKGFFGALFDFSFSHFITPMVVKVVYILGLIAMSLAFVILLVASFADSTAAGLVTLVIGPVVLLLYLCLFRMTLEFYVAIVRMSEDINHRLPRT